MADLQSGSLRAIIYELFHIVDEIIHGLRLLPESWEFRFCQWSHRYDDNGVWEAPDAS